MRLGTGLSGATLDQLHTVRRVTPVSGRTSGLGQSVPASVGPSVCLGTTTAAEAHFFIMSIDAMHIAWLPPPGIEKGKLYARAKVAVTDQLLAASGGAAAGSPK